MTVPICDHGSLTYNRDLFKNISENSLFSVFRSGEQIFDTLQLKDLQQLAAKGADINEVDPEYGMNFLQRLIVEEFSLTDREGTEFRKILEWLYSNGIDLNHQDVNGRTALHIATSEDDFAMVEWLVDKGANKSIVDQDSETAYDYVKNIHRLIISRDLYTRGGVTRSYVNEIIKALDLLRI